MIKTYKNIDNCINIYLICKKIKTINFNEFFLIKKEKFLSGKKDSEVVCCFDFMRIKSS